MGDAWLIIGYATDEVVNILETLDARYHVLAISKVCLFLFVVVRVLIMPVLGSGKSDTVKQNSQGNNKGGRKNG